MNANSKILSVAERAYRATVEEQDDTVLWFTWTVRKAGAPIDVLLRGNTVNYVVKGQEVSGLTFGEVSFGNPPAIEHDLQEMMKESIKIYVVREDLETRGINPSDILNGTHLISSKEIAGLYDQYDQIWHW
ncbi:MAG: DsrE family protein [Candidatus Omnitrophica bacterium]|nr:DsrE family protein [Candidatus Omnitrophota bacterium]